MTDQAMQPLEPLVVRSDEGEARWWFGALAEVKATAADTGGQMTVVEVTEPPGIEARGDQRARPEPHPPAPARDGRASGAARGARGRSSRNTATNCSAVRGKPTR